MKAGLLAGLLCLTPLGAVTHYVTIAGLGGEPDYEQRFTGWAADVEKILQSAPDVRSQVLKGPQATRQNVKQVFSRLAGEAAADDALVVMLIGHGTFDGDDYKFNLPGPDLTAADLAALAGQVPAQRQLILAMTSASGGGLKTLAKPGRIVIAATRSGFEKNATVFARYWIEALRDAAADTDKNGAVSALEAFRFAEAKTARFYESQKRIATEHAVLDDLGKGEGVRAPSPENGYGLVAAAFPVVRLAGGAAAASDPAKRKLFARKEQLEQEVDRLKYQKAAIPTEEYRRKLSALLLELAKTQEELDQ